MAKLRMIDAVLAQRAKWGGEYYPEGSCKVPQDAIEDLRDARVLVSADAEEHGLANQRQALAADLTQPLSADQVSTLRMVLADLGGEGIKSDGSFKVSAVNAALKERDAGFKVTADQLAALPAVEPEA